MRKIYAVAAALLMLAPGFGKCDDAAKFLKAAFKDGEGTPENSVLVYGKISTVQTMHFSQMDSDFLPDNQNVIFFSKDGSVFCLAPVAPGSYNMAGHVVTLSGRTITWGYFPLQGSIWDFRAPSRPGLYYYGAYDFVASDRTGERVALADQNREELRCLRLLAKHLKKTSWNEAVQKRIAELEGE